MFGSPLSITLAVVGVVLLTAGIAIAISKRAWTTGDAPSSQRAARSVIWSLALIYGGAAFWLILAWVTEGVPTLSSGVFTATVVLSVLSQIPNLCRAIRRARQQDE